MATSVSDFGVTVRNALAPPGASSGLPVTPVRKKAAIQCAQVLEKEWMTTEDLVMFITLLERNKEAADAYSALDNPGSEDIRKLWIEMKLKDMKLN